jgi:hypothetical protein
MPDENPFLNLTDADLKAALLRAIRTIGILSLVAAPVIFFLSGWQSACLFLVGAAISAAGVHESQRLIGIVTAKLDNQKSPRSTGLVLAMFFLRLAIAGVALYVSLRCLDGSAYAMIAGLALAVVALSFEVLKLTRS